jgi:type II secretory pathway component HofQ
METSITAEESTITTAAEVTTTDPAAAAATTTQEATLHPQPEEATAKIEEVQRSDVVMKEEEKATPMDTTGAISEPSKEEEKPSNATNE